MCILTDMRSFVMQIIRAIKPAMVDLPTRQSVGCISFADLKPDERYQAASLPQQYYVASMVCWKDAREDDKMHQWLAQVNESMKHAALGVYVADFNQQFAVKKVCCQIYNRGRELAIKRAILDTFRYCFCKIHSIAAEVGRTTHLSGIQRFELLLKGLMASQKSPTSVCEL